MATERLNWRDSLAGISEGARVIPVYEATELHARFLGNSFLALNSVLSKEKALFCAEID